MRAFALVAVATCVASAVDTTCSARWQILNDVGVCKGNNIHFGGISNDEECCAKCTGNCTGWTFHSNTSNADKGAGGCFITSDKIPQRGTTKGVTSGVKIVPTPPPTPAKPTLPPSPPAAGKQPHILMILGGLQTIMDSLHFLSLLHLVDDWGWANVGYHRKEYNDTTPEVQTPNIDQLVAEGIELNRNYVFKVI